MLRSLAVFLVAPRRVSSLSRQLCLTVSLTLAAWFSGHAYAQAPTLVTPFLIDATQNKPYSQSILIGGTPPPASVSVSGLPSGLVATQNGSGSVELAGIPLVAGTYNLAIAVSNTAKTADFAVSLSVKSIGNFSPMVYGQGQVATGGNRTCAVIDGGVQCWGTNSYYLLPGFNLDGLRYQIIAPGSGATWVAVSYEHGCAVVNSGVQCWGSNEYGQLGDGSRTYSVTPVQTIASGSGVSALATGGVCAILNGGLWCWGGEKLFPSQFIPAGSGVTMASQNCAVVGGGLRCWGSNWAGEIGIAPSSPQATPIQTIAPGSGVTAVASGGSFSSSCAVVRGGVQCWGYLYENTLPDARPVPGTRLFQMIPPDSGVTDIAVGQGFTCAVINGGVRCWGDVRSGRFGIGGQSNYTTATQAIAVTCAVADLVSADNPITLLQLKPSP
jgi:hypothetical protein